MYSNSGGQGMPLDTGSTKRRETFWGDNDELMIKRAQQGDSKAMEELLFACEKRVYNISYRFMGNEADAYDIAQESLIKIYKNITSFKGESSLSSWVYRLTVNTCMDALRKRKNAPVSLEYTMDKGMPFEDTFSATPEENALSIEKSEDIQKAINILSESYKTVIIMRDVDGYTYEEISQMLDISVGTVKSRINRGRQKLKELLADH
jgi:RNA polymerase sigma-70 factor (ECF subfamily)